MSKKITVFDFLYVDAPRVRSLISQLHDSGVLDELVETSITEREVSGSAAGSTKFGIGGWNPVEGMAEGAGKISGSKEAQRRYDTQYTLPIKLLDLLSASGVIASGATEWRFGSIAKFTGETYFLDLSSLHGAWSEILDASSGLEGEALITAKSLFNTMPPTVHAIIHKGAVKVWCNMLREHWVTPPSSITLSHGSHIDGDWTVLGIVDALGGERAKSEYIRPVESQIYDHFGNVGNVMRQLMGRPDGCYGLSPLLVYRTVTRKS